MDHLPYPDNAAYPLIQIPYLVNEDVARYEGGGFEGFPQEAGWMEGEGTWFDCEPCTAAARAQAWLYLGLLKEIMGCEIYQASFVTSNQQHGLVLSTKRGLPPLLRRRFRSKEPLVQLMYMAPHFFILLVIISMGTLLLKAEMRQRISGTRKKQHSNINRALVTAERELRSLETTFPYCSDVLLVCLSIRALVWSIRNASAHQDPTVLKRSYMEMSSSPFLERTLIERGMCPHYLAIINERSSVATLHFLSGLDRPVLQHQDCTSGSCTANILDPSTYVTVHVEKDCNCDFIGPDTTEIFKAIDEGDIPVICLSLHEDTVLIKTQRSGFDNPYMAISHVWSGGLGNQNSSSLPICQLRHIYSLITSLAPPEHSKGKWYHGLMGRLNARRDLEKATEPSTSKPCVLWMDTLCLPKQRPQRNQAISQMSRIYAEAQYVVVLDKSLQKISSGASDEEILANLVSSPWMSRCWTFQEGRLAQKLLMNVQHSLMDPFVVYNQVATMVASFRFGFGFYKWSNRLQLRREMSSLLYRLRPLKDEAYHSTDFEDFVHMWNELASRTTSWQEDRINIFTLMLDLNVNEIQSILGTGERLKAILRTQDYLPISFLFNETSIDHLCNEDHWIPENLFSKVQKRDGCMFKTKDIGTGEAGFMLELDSDVLALVKPSSTWQGRYLRLWKSDDGNRQRAHILNITFPSSTSDEPASHGWKASANTNYVYFLRNHRPLRDELSTLAARGCRFHILKERPSYIALAYDCSFTYTWEKAEDVTSASNRISAFPRQLQCSDRIPSVNLRCGRSDPKYLRFKFRNVD